MPDWSYHPLFRPLLFFLPDHIARKLALGSMHTFKRLPGGRSVITWLGQTKPPVELKREWAGLVFPSPVGITGEVDGEGLGIGPLSLMGFGFLDVGVATLKPRTGQIVRDGEKGSLLA